MTYLTVDSLWLGFLGILTVAINNDVRVVRGADNSLKSKIKHKYPAGIRREITRKRCISRKLKNSPQDSELLTAYHNSVAECRTL
jgi:hypothetical protein